MSIRSKIFAAALVAASFASASANAASYVVESSLPFYFTGACKTASSTGAFATGTVVSSGNYSGGCVGAYTVDLDTTAKTITLTGFEDGDYQLNSLRITGITEATITGLNLVSLGNLFDLGGYILPSTQLSFTGDSIDITFTTDISTGEEFKFANGGRAVFSYAAGAVPEPGTWAMMLAGFGMMGFSLRRRGVTKPGAAIA